MQVTTEDGKTIDIKTSLDRSRIVPYRENEEELPYYNEIEYYEEIVFTDYSVKSYSWGWNSYDDNNPYYEWECNMEVEYHVRDNAILYFGIKGPTIEKLTTKELLLAWP